MIDKGIKLPPQAIELEEAVLGALLIERDIQEFITSMVDVFYNKRNSIIFNSIVDMNIDGKNIDLLTVTEYLRKSGKLENVGGISYLVELTSKIASAMHFHEHYTICLEKLILRNTIKKCTEIIESCYKDEDIENIESEAVKLSSYISQSISGEITGKQISEIAELALQDTIERKENLERGITTGIHCGIHQLHDITGGWQKSDLIIVAARPSMGKTAIAIQFAKWPAKRNSKILFFSLEMDEKSITNRAILGETEINPEEWRNGTIGNDALDNYEAIKNHSKKWDLKIYDQSTITPAHVRTACKEQLPDMVIIDYLQLMTPPATNRKNSNRNEDIGSITRELKRIAKDFSIPVILLAQLNRGVENRSVKIPTLSDLRDSGEIEQDADIVIFPYRPYVYDQTEENREVIEIIVAKHRNGRTGAITAHHNKYMNKFFDTKDIEPF